LPRRLDGKTFTSSFTKFAIVGSGRDSIVGVTVGDDVCEAKGGLTDEAAADYFRDEVQQQLSSHAPELLSCVSHPEACSGKAIGVQEPLAFLGALLGPRRSLKGNVLPVVMHGGSITSGARLGDAMALLVAPGGIWEAERVLFVVSGDFSEGLDAAQAEHCDSASAELMAQGGVAQAAAYFEALRSGASMHGCAGGAGAAPRDVSPIMAAIRIAERAQLIRRRALIGHDGTGPSIDWRKSSVNPTIRGYAAVLFWENSRSVWERVAAKSLIERTPNTTSGRFLRAVAARHM